MKKPFEGIYGNTCELRVLDFLLPLEGIEFNLTELEKEMNVTRQTLSKVMKKHEECGLVKSRMRGNAKYYSINKIDPLIEDWIRMNNHIIEKMLSDEQMYEIRDALTKPVIPQKQHLEVTITAETASIKKIH